MSENLRNKANLILKEFMPSENTAVRVGDVLVDAVNEVDEIKQLSRELTENMTELLNGTLDEINGEATIGETSAQKLRNILNSKASIKEAIQSKGVDMLDSPVFRDYAERIGSIPNSTGNEGNEEWSPNTTWWDIESIIQDSDNQEYTYKTIQLLLDSDITTAFTGGEAYKTSDGQYYTSTDVTHTWDTTLDIQCIEEEKELYKTRWVITYHSSPSIEMNYIQRNCLYFIMDGVLPTIAKIGNGDFPTLINSFKLINSADFTFITDFSGMFAACISLKSIPPIKTLSGTNFSEMFAACISLKSIPSLDTSSGTDFSSMFEMCTSLIFIPPLDTSSGTYFSSMFESCYKLTSVSSLSTVNGIHFNQMFSTCLSLRVIEDKLDVSKAATNSNNPLDSAFNGCYSLMSVKIENVPKYLDLSSCLFLDHESLMFLINNLVKTTNYNTLELGKTNLAKLTDSEKLIAAFKGWLLV